jgi:hypothetical protein
MVQESHSRGYVFLILTGYCEVVTFDGSSLTTLAQLQAGEIIGEMAVITGSKKRNASVVASSPVTVCVFPEATFNAFITNEGHRDKLLKRWDLRLRLRQLPLFRSLISTVLEKLAHSFRTVQVPYGENFAVSGENWFVLCEGTGSLAGTRLKAGDELGYRPLLSSLEGEFRAGEDSLLLYLPRAEAEAFHASTPQFNFLIRKFRIASGHTCDWLLGEPGKAGA